MLIRGFATRMVVAAVTALGLSVLITPGAGTSPAGPASFAAPSGPRPDVVLIGESLLEQVAPIETDLLTAAHLRPAIEARDSQSLGSPFIQQRVQQAVARATPIVVLETASNDAYLGAGTAPPGQWPVALARYRATLAATLARLAHQCTVLVDTRVTATSRWYGLDRIGPAIDQALAASARHGTSPVEVVAWSTASAGHGSDWFWTDGLHFGDPDHRGAGWHTAGAVAYARAVADGVAACSADLRSRTPRRT